MRKLYNNIVNFLSFSNDLRKLRRAINQSIDVPEVIQEFPDSHPKGFIKEFKKRRTTIAETYLRITKSLESANYKERIEALNLLSEHINYSRSLQMPLNAARVQLALMKEVVKNRENKRLQLEYMRDFTVSSFGHSRSIRKFLKKLDMLEVPETGEQLKDLRMGWDYHVHDNSSYGRKEPTQLLIDAFIKGMSEITIAHNNLNAEDAVKEALEAGRILGIKVNIAIEFSALTHGKRFHYMYILPHFSSKKKKFKQFLKQKADDLKEFLNELDENEKKRTLAIKELIQHFNQHFLPQINLGFSPESIYYLQPLSIENDGNNDTKLFSRRQLGEFLYPKMLKVLEKRALYITTLKNRMGNFPNDFSQEEKKKIEQQFLKIRNEYRTLSPEKLRIQYFSHTEKNTVETAVSSLDDIFKLAQNTGAHIKFIQPLEHGLHEAVLMILVNYKMLAFTEIYNLYDSIDTQESDFIEFTKFIDFLNKSEKENLLTFCAKHQIKIDVQKLEQAADYFKNKKIIPTIGSDATGRSTFVPGMGFIFQRRIKREQFKYFKTQHFNLPDEVSELIYKMGDAPKPRLGENHQGKIISLGRIDKYHDNELGDQDIEPAISPAYAWEYLNPAIRNFIFILIGFIPAYFTVGIEYAMLWFAITGSRNVFVDLISGNGFKPNEWNAENINWTNIANSLFWTGFSVPILGFVKSQFDVIWTAEHTGSIYEFSKFFFINTANGMYLASHNYIRGFDKATIRANFFRSILAWPFSAAFSPVGNALGLPSIVQAKFWSDFVAAIIEGSAKYKNILQLKARILKSLLPDLEHEGDIRKLAVLDLVYLFQENNRTKIVLKEILTPKKKGFFTKFRFYKNIGKERKPEYYQMLLNWFENKQSYEKMTDFIIRNYLKQQSVYLLNLISRNYISFHLWLKKIKK